MLWRDTIFKDHYRSIDDGTFALTTPNNINRCNLAVIRHMDFFWLSANGAKPIDAVVPDFVGGFVIRGGIQRICLTNRANETTNRPADPVRITIYAVWTTPNPISINSFTMAEQPTLFDPSSIPNFNQYGKVKFRREVVLKGDGETVEVMVRFKPQRIDRDIYIAGGNRLVWLVTAAQCSNTETIAAPETVDIVVLHSISFCGDVG